MSGKGEAQAMLLMLKGALLGVSEEERNGILNAVVSVKTLARELVGDAATLVITIANLEMSLEDGK